MKLIELHILQSFPVSCLNRDDLNAPKTAVFGGTNRARISSQCLKRAIRLTAKEDPEYHHFFSGQRSRLIVTPLQEALQAHGLETTKASDLAKAFCGYVATFDEASFKATGTLKSKTLIFLSPSERAEAAKQLAALKDTGDKNLAKEMKQIAKKIAGVGLLDAADIAIFGRMVANDPSLNIEAAAMFGHALSTHRAENDLDFFTAVDDLQREDSTLDESDKTGSGMMGTLEFNSATFYRYAALNLTMLSDAKHLEKLPASDFKGVVSTFIRATLLAVPGARQNSMNASTLPGYVLATLRETGQPIQLINAFEKPVTPKNGILHSSQEALQAHWEDLKKTWDIKPAVEVSLPATNFHGLCEALCAKL